MIGWDEIWLLRTIPHQVHDKGAVDHMAEPWHTRLTVSHNLRAVRFVYLVVMAAKLKHLRLLSIADLNLLRSPWRARTHKAVIVCLPVTRCGCRDNWGQRSCLPLVCALGMGSLWQWLRRHCCWTQCSTEACVIKCLWYLPALCVS